MKKETPQTKTFSKTGTYKIRAYYDTNVASYLDKKLFYRGYVRVNSNGYIDLEITEKEFLGNIIYCESIFWFRNEEAFKECFSKIEILKQS